MTSESVLGYTSAEICVPNTAFRCASFTFLITKLNAVLCVTFWGQLLSEAAVRSGRENKGECHSLLFNTDMGRHIAGQKRNRSLCHKESGVWETMSTVWWQGLCLGAEGWMFLRTEFWRKRRVIPSVSLTRGTGIRLETLSHRFVSTLWSEKQENDGNCVDIDKGLKERGVSPYKP